MSDRLPWERPLGSRVLDDHRTEFRVWAPSAPSLKLWVAGRGIELHAAGYGVYETVTTAQPGDDYWYEIDGQRLPDPCSRWQPDGLRGPSRVLSSSGQHPPFERPPLNQLVIYELHVGTFTAEGTFDSAIEHLAGLAELGITAIEIMPVAEFPGARGWGYDGVYLSSAHSSYGGPEALRRLVDSSHEAGLAVILDVVYNHLGTSGVEAMEAFGPYFTSKYETPWGKAINYDDADSDPVREWVCQSAEGWIAEFGIDGLRLDAIHAIFDSSAEHIVAAVARRVHAVDPGAYVIAESGLNDPAVIRPRERGGHGCDAAWSDDFHHALHALLTGERDGYYADFGRVGQLAKALQRPHVFDGGYSSFRRRRFGAPADDVPVNRFVVYSQDHDQVGNRAFGDRLPPGPAAAGGADNADVAVRGAAVHGRGVRRAGAVSVLLKPYRRGDRDRHPRGPAARVRGVRLVQPGGSRSRGPGDLRAVKIDAAGHPRDRGAVPPAAGGARAPQSRRGRGDRVRRVAAVASPPPRPLRGALQLRHGVARAAL